MCDWWCAACGWQYDWLKANTVLTIQASCRPENAWVFKAYALPMVKNTTLTFSTSFFFICVQVARRIKIDFRFLLLRCHVLSVQVVEVWTEAVQALMRCKAHHCRLFSLILNFRVLVSIPCQSRNDHVWSFLPIHTVLHVISPT